MFAAAARRVHRRRRGPTAISAAVVSLSLAGCALASGTPPSPTETSEITALGTPTSEGTDLPSTEPAGDSERTSNEIVPDLLGTVRDLTAYSPGEWTYFDGTPFDPTDTSGYTSETCGEQAGQSININVAGPPTGDIAVVEQEIVDAYTSRGWEVVLRQQTDLPEGKVLDVSFTDATGKRFSFGLGPTGTAIILESECSTHPSLDEPST